MDQRWRTSHQDTEREKIADQVSETSVIAPVQSCDLLLTLLPFDGAEESRASLIVESDDDARGGKVCVIIQRGTPAGRAQCEQLPPDATKRTHAGQGFGQL